MSDIDDLIVAIEALKSNPWLDVLIPAVSGVVGVTAGFFLSIARGSYDRKAARRDEISGAIRDRRQSAVDTLSTESKWILTNHGRLMSVGERSPHTEARTTGPELFDKTGKVSDDVVTPEARAYLHAIDFTLRSYVRVDTSDGHPQSDYHRLTKEITAKVRAEVSLVREAAQRWVDEDRESEWFRAILSASRGRLKSLQDVPEDAAPAGLS